MFSAYGFAGVLLAGGAVGSVAAALWLRGRSLRLRASFVAAALGFQLVHVAEHGLQAGAWAADPGARPWMSPWAVGTASGVGEWCSLVATTAGSDPLGNELLHLFGNVIFLAGLATMVGCVGLVAVGHARRAFVIQGLHVLEHVVLTGTLILTGTAHGVSTMIDDVIPVGGPTARVWFHFGINALATAYAVAAVRAVGWRPWAAVIGLAGSEQVGPDDAQSSSPQFDRPDVLHAP